jgi:predicted transcriptional regulator
VTDKKEISLSRFMEETGRTQESIATGLAVSQGTVSRWLASSRDIFVRRTSRGMVEVMERTPPRRLGAPMKATG